jgi:hypothetical protein
MHLTSSVLRTSSPKREDSSLGVFWLQVASRSAPKQSPRSVRTQVNARRWAVPCKTKVHFMKFSKALLLSFLIVCIWCSGCNSSSGKTPDYQILQEQDKACRQTIQNYYSIEFYCPNNLNALKSLYTDSYNQYFVLSLDSCSYVSSYKILELLSSRDPNYPKLPNIDSADGFLMYYAEVEMNVFPGKQKPGYNPFMVWITMQIDKSGECKINDFSGGA